MTAVTDVFLTLARSFVSLLTAEPSRLIFRSPLWVYTFRLRNALNSTHSPLWVYTR